VYSGTAYAPNNCGALIQKRSSKDFHHFEIAKTPKPFEKVQEMIPNPHQFQQIPMMTIGVWNVGYVTTLTARTVDL
jgi:hypothetical protein